MTTDNIMHMVAFKRVMVITPSIFLTVCILLHLINSVVSMHKLECFKCITANITSHNFFTIVHGPSLVAVSAP